MENALKHRHSNDALSVDRLVKELQNETTIIAYKPQGIHDDVAYPLLTEDNFLLVIMTEFQCDMFKKHSEKVVCVDSTHKTNPYGFKLVTIVVPDEFKNGKISVHIVVSIHITCMMCIIARNLVLTAVTVGKTEISGCRNVI